MTAYATIDEALADFDFARVRRAMLALGWTWHNEGTPSEESMRITVGRLHADLFGERSAVEMQTGGFILRRVTPGEDYDNGMRFELHFDIGRSKPEPVEPASKPVTASEGEGARG